jgi:hypothetical protein
MHLARSLSMFTWQPIIHRTRHGTIRAG